MYYVQKIQLHSLKKLSIITTFGVAIFKSSSLRESRIFSCSADRINVGVVIGDHTLPDSIFCNVGTLCVYIEM